MSGCKIVALALVFVMAFMFLAPAEVHAQNALITALKLFGIAYVVSRFGPQINSFINNLAGQRGVRWEGVTKVVPIISVGTGAYIGAAQVQGPADRVGGTRAVAQVETRISEARGRLLIPVGTTNVRSGYTRIQGVGLSAMIDFRL